MSDGDTFDVTRPEDRARLRELLRSRSSDPLYVAGFTSAVDDSLVGATVRAEGARVRFSPLALLSFLAYASEIGIRPTTIESNRGRSS